MIKFWPFEIFQWPALAAANQASNQKQKKAENPGRRKCMTSSLGGGGRKLIPGPVLEQLAVGLLDLQADLDDPVEELANLLKVCLLETPGGHGWRAHACTSRCHCTHVSYHCILVQRDVTEVACLLQLVACQALHNIPLILRQTKLAVYLGENLGRED